MGFEPVWVRVMTIPWASLIPIAIVAMSVPAPVQQAQGQRPVGKSVETFVDYMAPAATLEALTSSAELVVLGRAHSPKRVMVGNLVGTEYRVTVHEVLKDNQGRRDLSEITLVELGGETTRAEPPVRLRPDAVSVFFLSVWPAVRGYSIVSGGAFPIEDSDVVIPSAVRHMKAFAGRDRMPQGEFVALVKKAMGLANHAATPPTPTFQPEHPFS